MSVKPLKGGSSTLQLDIADIYMLLGLDENGLVANNFQG